VPVAGLEQLADGHRGVDQADVRVGLREIAQQRPAGGRRVITATRKPSSRSGMDISFALL